MFVSCFNGDLIINTTLRSVSNENSVIPKPALSDFKESLSYSGLSFGIMIPYDSSAMDEWAIRESG